MKHIIKSEEGERTKNAKEWYLTIYDDEKEEIKEITEFQYFEEED